MNETPRSPSPVCDDKLHRIITIMRTTPTLVLAALSTASALVVQPMPTRTAVRVSGRSRDINCVASSSEDKALLAASQKVTLVAKRFGKEQGKAAQTWVEQAVKTGDASSDNLMQMQLALFEECKLDDGGKCADLSAAIDALTSAVDARKKGDSDVCAQLPHSNHANHHPARCAAWTAGTAPSRLLTFLVVPRLSLLAALQSRSSLDRRRSRRRPRSCATRRCASARCKRTRRTHGSRR